MKQMLGAMFYPKDMKKISGKEKHQAIEKLHKFFINFTNSVLIQLMEEPNFRLIIQTYLQRPIKNIVASSPTSR